MKKTFLTFIATVFFISVGFAQSAEFTETQLDDSQLEKAEPSVFMYQDEPERKEVEMEALPVAVQDAFINGQYSEMEVLAIYEIAAALETEADVYELELAQKVEGAESFEMEGVEIEKVNNRQPAIILQVDKNGQIVEEVNFDEVK